MTQKDSDLKKIKELIKIMQDNDLVEVEIKHGDDKISLKRSQPQQTTITAIPMVSPNVLPGANGIESTQQDKSAGAEQQNLLEIKSPIVGIFYATPSPDSDHCVEIGSQVDPQTVVCIIESMKVMNEIKAETSGTIVKILCKAGQAVEYGQVLFKVKPD